MLFRDDVSLKVVEAPPAFPSQDYDGLAVTDEDLPPLLTPAMLTDPAGYSAWERHMVGRCAADCSPESVVATLAADAGRLRAWKPGAVSLAETVQKLPADVVSARAPRDLGSSFEREDEVRRAIPDEWQPPPDREGLSEAYAAFVVPVWGMFATPVNRYLAGKAFASWTAYQGKGVATIVRGLEAALALVRVEASRQCRNAGRNLNRDLLLEGFRRADFILNHLAGGEELAIAWSHAEDE